MFGTMKDRVNKWMHPKEKYLRRELYSLLFEISENENFTEELESTFGIDIIKRPVQVGVIRVGEAACDPEKLHMIMKSCIRVSDSDEVLPVSDCSNQVILLFFRDTLWEGQAREILEDTQKEFLAVWPDSRLFITLGSIEDYIEEGEPAWRKSYRVAIGLQDYCYIKPRGKIVSHTDIIARRHIYPKGISFHFDLLKEYLEAKNSDLIHGWLSGIYSMISGEGMDTIGLRYHLTLEIVVNAISILRENGHSPEVYIAPPEILINEVLELDTLQCIQQWTGKFLENCRNLLQKSDVL